INTKSYVSHDVDGKQTVELNELTYEYDHAGYRFDAGMKSGWSSLQSLGDVTTLNGQKVYGTSFGNVAKSVKSSAHNTLVPVIICMPGNGEA
ncbi:hypothetical protein, partial [Aeromonas hydrophila]|uniref:hypothetical protein n=1 Tax=Aeromonas hydrophila TaxID=644 RepID=UPI0036DD2DAE